MSSPHYSPIHICLRGVVGEYIDRYITYIHNMYMYLLYSAMIVDACMQHEIVTFLGLQQKDSLAAQIWSGGDPICVAL